MKALSNIDKLKAFIGPKITDIITLLNNNIKYDVYTGGDINGIYCYLEMIGSPTTFANSVHFSHHLGPLISINNDISSLRTI